MDGWQLRCAKRVPQKSIQADVYYVCGEAKWGSRTGANTGLMGGRILSNQPVRVNAILVPKRKNPRYESVNAERNILW